LNAAFGFIYDAEPLLKRPAATREIFEIATQCAGLAPARERRHFVGTTQFFGVLHGA
jgi:hypothetical protein